MKVGDIVIFNNKSGIWHEMFTDSIGKVIKISPEPIMYHHIVWVEIIDNPDSVISLPIEQFDTIKDTKLLRLLYG